MWLANKTQCVPEGAFGGQGPSPRSRQTTLILCFLQNTTRWNLYFSNVNFPLRHCHLWDRPQRVQREREDISCIISFSCKRCHCDLVHDMPSWCHFPSLVLSYMILSHTDALFYQSACLFLSALPGFPLLYLLLYNCGQLLAGETAHCGLSWPYLLPLHSGRNARCRLYTHFDHMVKRECFLLLLDGTFKKPFLHPLCLRRMSDENSDRFFPTRSASSGIVSGPLLPLVPNPPHLLIETPNISFPRQGFRVEEVREEGRKRHSIFWKQTRHFEE